MVSFQTIDTVIHMRPDRAGRSYDGVSFDIMTLEGAEMPGPAKQRILFVCVGNSCRSQMAEGFARHFFGDAVEVYSAGSRPAGFVAPLTIEVMRECGIDIRHQYSKSLQEVPAGPYDVVATMGCGDACPWIPATHRLEWEIPDPISLGPEVYRAVRDTIKEKVRSLSSLLGIPLKT